jgi:hypothetical protein
VKFLVLTAASMTVAVIALMMEAASTSVNFYQTTWRNNPEDSCLIILIFK